MFEPKFKVNDKVRKVGGKGIRGTVKEIRSEVTSRGDMKERGILVTVLWDNGSLTFLGEGALELVS